jgi:septal ring-binding cell division protein DamX
MVLSVENLVILTIMSIMVMIFCFSFGVERGKRIALSDVNGMAVAPVAAPVVVSGNTPPKASQAVADKKVVADDDADLEDKPKTNILTGVLALFGGHGGTAASVQTAVQDKAVAPAPEAKVLKTAQTDPGKDKALKPVPVVQAKDAIAKPGNGVYTVQVASYKSQKFAKKEADALTQKGFRDVQVVPKGAYVIVCVGNFPSKTDASAYTSKLKNRYQDPVVRRL